jgi:hypothetical protein
VVGAPPWQIGGARSIGPELGIRGTTSREEAQELAEEGIELMPLLVPDALKQPVH